MPKVCSRPNAVFTTSGTVFEPLGARRIEEASRRPAVVQSSRPTIVSVDSRFVRERSETNGTPAAFFVLATEGIRLLYRQSGAFLCTESRRIPPGEGRVAVSPAARKAGVSGSSDVATRFPAAPTETGSWRVIGLCPGGVQVRTTFVDATGAVYLKATDGLVEPAGEAPWPRSQLKAPVRRSESFSSL